VTGTGCCFCCWRFARCFGPCRLLEALYFRARTCLQRYSPNLYQGQLFSGLLTQILPSQAIPVFLVERSLKSDLQRRQNLGHGESLWPERARRGVSSVEQDVHPTRLVPPAPADFPLTSQCAPVRSMDFASFLLLHQV
jgi:hypothetical protein